MASQQSNKNGAGSSPKEETKVPTHSSNSEEEPTLKTKTEQHEESPGGHKKEEDYRHEGDENQRKKSPPKTGQRTDSTTKFSSENPDELFFGGASPSISPYHHSEAPQTAAAEDLRSLSSAPPTSGETSKLHRHHHHHDRYDHHHQENSHYYHPHHSWGNPPPPPPYGGTYHYRHPHPDEFVGSVIPFQPHDAHAYTSSAGPGSGAPNTTSAAYPSGMMMPPPHVSSFESHHSHVNSSGSGDVSDPNNVSSAGPPVVDYGPYPPPSTPGGSSGTAIGYSVVQWAPVTRVTYVTDVRPNDVLSGRGGATNSHSGNKNFRSLVKEFQDRYLQAKKRDKPSVASIIVEQIRKNGGRFLRRVDNNSQPGGQQALWFDIGDERAREKTCQALREGAPEIRRKKKNASGDEDDTRRSDSTTDHDLNTERKLSSTFSSTEQTPDSSSSDKQHLDGHIAARSVVEQELDGNYPKKEGPITIRPSSRFIPGEYLKPISVDQLDPEDREIYLRDFLPPDPTIRHKTGKVQILEVSRYARGNASRQIVKV